ncbi:MAG: hypothetical protein HY569_01980 [Candidatus Magasanikbacteria bacterium]|nr:hypothetical protein [Candidatus Magasanikbacteria bacterium]
MDTEDKNKKYNELMARLGGESAKRTAEQEPWRDAKPNSLVGWYLGPCVRYILEGKVTEAQVRKIFISQFRSEDDEVELAQLIDECRRKYWLQDPAEGEAIARRLWGAKKIVKSDEEPGSGFIKDWVNMGDNVSAKIVKETIIN